MLSPTLLVQLKFLCEARLLMIDLLSHKFVYLYLQSFFTFHQKFLCVEMASLYSSKFPNLAQSKKNYLNLRLKQFSVITVSSQGFRHIHFSVIGPEKPCNFLNQSETNRNQSRLVHELFPALQSVLMFFF